MTLRPHCVLRGQAAACSEATSLSFRPAATASAETGDDDDVVPPQLVLAAGDLVGSVTLWNLVTRRPLLAFSPALQAKGVDAEPTMYNNPALLHVCFLTHWVLLTQTRSRQVHLWDVERMLRPDKASDEVPLLATTAVTQFGFCPIGCLTVAEERQWLLLPEDGDTKSISVQLVQHHGVVESRVALVLGPVKKIHASTPQKLGMAMCISTGSAPAAAHHHVVVGYESGHLVVFGLSECCDAAGEGAAKYTLHVKCFYIVRAYSEPIVALVAAVPSQGLIVAYATSAAGSLQKYMWNSDEQGSTSAKGKAALFWEDHIPIGANTCALMQPEARVLIVGAWDGTLRMYDALCGKRIALLEAHAAGLTSVDVQPPTTSAVDSRAPQRRLVACASSDRTISVWEIDVPGQQP